MEVEPFPPNFYLFDILDFQIRPLFKNKSFLQKKYVEEGLSISQIAAQIFSSRFAVRKDLELFGIPRREPHRPQDGLVVRDSDKRFKRERPFPIKRFKK